LNARWVIRITPEQLDEAATGAALAVVAGNAPAANTKRQTGVAATRSLRGLRSILFSFG
jgi:hypothetical protein